MREQKPNLKEGALLHFSEYLVKDGETILAFLCFDPGPGQASEYTIILTDAEMKNLPLNDFRKLCQDKLDRKLREKGIRASLDQFLGEEFTI